MPFEDKAFGLGLQSHKVFVHGGKNPGAAHFSVSGNHDLGVETLQFFNWDVNRDGRLDLVLYSRLDETSLTRTSTEGVLKGLTYGDVAIEGKDVVHMLGHGHWEDRCGDRYGRWEGYESHHDHGRDHDDPDCRSDWHFR